MNAPYDYRGLWLKAKVFLNHAMDSDQELARLERAFWASAALELLAKSALARISPLLIAIPSEDGANLLIAGGAMVGDARFKSISAATVFGRCHKAFKPFNEREANRIAQNRNEYLHGCAPGFLEIPAEAWWAKYWAQAAILVEHIDSDLEDLVGPDRVEAVERYLALNARNIEERVESLLEHAQQRVSLRESSNPPAWIIREFERVADLTIAVGYETEEICPVCHQVGSLEGSEVSEYNIKFEQVGEDDFDEWVDLTVYAEHFSCKNCRLVLGDYELIDSAGLPTTFGAIGDLADFPGEEYGND